MPVRCHVACSWYMQCRAVRNGFPVTVLRPQIVCGFALGNPMNVVSALGLYA